jgi:hypothetical protein
MQHLQRLFPNLVPDGFRPRASAAYPLPQFILPLIAPSWRVDGKGVIPALPVSEAVVAQLPLYVTEPSCKSPLPYSPYSHTPLQSLSSILFGVHRVHSGSRSDATLFSAKADLRCCY